MEGLMEGLHCKDCSTVSESVKKSFLIIRLNFLVLYVSFLFSLCYCYCYCRCRCQCHIKQLFLLVFTAYLYIQTIITSSYNNIPSVLVVQRVLFVSTGETLYTRNFPVEKLHYSKLGKLLDLSSRSCLFSVALAWLYAKIARKSVYRLHIAEYFPFSRKSAREFPFHPVLRAKLDIFNGSSLKHTNTYVLIFMQGQSSLLLNLGKVLMQRKHQLSLQLDHDRQKVTE